MFYDNLIQECERQGLKATPIVIECGGASGSISGWKKGAMPNSEIVLKLSMRLDVSCDYLLAGKTITSNKSISKDEEKLLNNYKKLDDRGQHKIHTVIYEEIDRMENATKTTPIVPQNKQDIVS